MSEIAERSQSALPECMAPDGAEPCKGYSHLYLSALNVEQNLNNRIAELEAKIRRREAALDSFDAVERARQAESAKLKEAARVVTEDWHSEPVGIEGRWDAMDALAALVEVSDE